jgi:hypothetical protein
MAFRQFVLATFLFAVAGGHACAEEVLPVMFHAEQCLRDNADRVVAADSDLESAADFLLTYRCAPEIAAAARYQRNTAFAGVYNSMTNTQLLPTRKPMAHPVESVDPETGRIVIHQPPPGAKSASSIEIEQLGNSETEDLIPLAVPIALRKLAGDLVLAAQERRLAKGP